MLASPIEDGAQTLLQITTWGSVCAVSLSLAYDMCTLGSLPKPLKRILARMSAPFGHFLTVDDLEDPAEDLKIQTWKKRAVATLIALQAAVAGACSAYIVYNGVYDTALPTLVSLVSWMTALMQVVMKPMRTPPYGVIFIGLWQAAGNIVLLGAALANTAIYRLDLLGTSVSLAVSLIIIWICGTLPMQATPPAGNVAKATDMPSSTLSGPEDGVDLWQWSTFSFVSGIFKVAMARTINEEDVWSLSPFFRHKNLFNKYLAYTNINPKRSLIWFLLASNSLDLILDVLTESWSAFVGFVPPYALQRILNALSEDAESGKSIAFFWTVITFLANLSFAQVDLYQRWHTRRCYERTRGQLFCALHYKALKRRDISGKIDHDDDSADLGKVVNLMQGDAYAVAQRFWEFSALFLSPVRLVIALVFLYNILGWSALFGVAVVLVAYVLNYPLAKYNVYITRRSWKAKDARMGVVNELFQNIRFLKLYGWENLWGKQSEQAREKELGWRVKNNIVDVITSFIWTWIPSATALSSFLCYTLISGEQLTVAKAFTSISLFSYLQEPMTALPGQIFAMLHAYVSMQRIQAYLKEDEVPDWASTIKQGENPTFAADSQLGFKGGVFEWTAGPGKSNVTQFRLGPLDVMFPPRQLTLISGATGSGKSALLAGLLGEMYCLSGSVIVNKLGHELAYCAQNPWLEHATIRDNVIFGSSQGFDEDRYHAVLDACALLRDLEVFEAGDMTEIGEKGITLSGGQRARIALARAFYSEAKCILLDDILAAVDMHTAQHIVQKCLAGPLAEGRAIILVTHHISLCLSAASYLVELSRGKILRQGFIKELQDSGQLQKVIEVEDDTYEAELRDGSDENEEEDVNAGLKDENGKPGARPDGKLIEAEARAEGRVSLHTYLTYIRAAGTWTWILALALLVSIRLITILNQLFLAKWGEAYSPTTSVHSLRMRYPWDNLPPPETNVRPWLMVYLWISLAGAFATLASISLGYYASLKASRTLFLSMLRHLVRAPARFFDVTPIGRILNRFTTDINTIDGALQNSARSALSGTLNFLFSFGVILWIVPLFSPFALFIAWLYIRLSLPYVNASRDLRRLESISLSPAFAGFDELLRGLPHIRAFGMEARYQNNFYKKVDRFQNFDHVYWLVNGWLRWRYDCLGSVIVFLATMFALWSNVSSGFAALVIVQAGIFAEASRQLVKVAAQVELDFNSVERVVEYLDVPSEAPAIIADHRPPAYWPSNSGDVVIEDLVVRYAPDLPPALRGISCTIRAGEKLGVVGRTGSGKSTLALSLLRMVESNTGRITIDNIDISKIGLEDLRTRVTIVSQDVTTWSASLRNNLDPFGEHSDQECWDILQRCHLTNLLRRSDEASTAPLSLDMPISQSGSLSAGERQLLSLARAMLRKTNVIILDEATSQIDSDLDDQIQRTIRTELGHATIITIAHRLKTIVDYDRILVLDDGQIAELDTPSALLARPGGLFREMCRKSADWGSLRIIGSTSSSSMQS